MFGADETVFLNVDLELRSSSGLLRLLAELSRAVVILHADDGFAVLELDEQPGSPEEAVTRFATLVDQLTEAAREEWDECSERVLGIGIQSGVTPHQISYRLSARSLAMAANIRADVVFTVYARLQSRQKYSGRQS